MRKDTAQTGAAGVFHTAAQLSQRGWAANVTFGNMPRTDLLAQHIEGGDQIAVQCKAANTGGSFQLGQRGETPAHRGGNEWFVLVELFESDRRPTFYIVPRDVLAAFVWVGHRAWLTGKSPSGEPHQDNPMRSVQVAEVAPYAERWDLLEQPAGLAPYLLPDWFWDWEQRIGLPPGHPGAVKP